MLRRTVDWPHVRAIWLEIAKGEAPYFAGALAIAALGYSTLGSRIGWFSLLLAIPLAAIALPRALRRALARDYRGFRIAVIELQGKRDTMVSRSARRRAEEWAEVLGLPPAPDPPPDAERPAVETTLDRERTWRIYLVIQLWEAILVQGALVLSIPLGLVSKVFFGSWSLAPSLAIMTLWLAAVTVGSFWALRKALEHTYPDFHLAIEATRPAEARPASAHEVPHDMAAEPDISPTA